MHWKISFGILTYVNSSSLSSEPESIQRGRSSFQNGGNLYLLKVNKVTLFKETGRDVFCYSFLYENTHQFPQPLAILISMGWMVKQETHHHFKRGRCQNTQSPQGLLTFSTTQIYQLLKFHRLILRQNLMSSFLHGLVITLKDLINV